MVRGASVVSSSSGILSFGDWDMVCVDVYRWRGKNAAQV
jgi:hypothetical protein